MDNARRDYETYASAIVRARAGGSDLEFEGMGTEDAIAALEEKAKQLWDTYQYASSKYAEYTGIEWKPTAQPPLAGEAGAEGAGKDQKVEAIMGDYGDAELAIIDKKIREGKDFGSDEAVENMQNKLVQQGRQQLIAAGDDPEKYSYEELLKRFGMTAAQEKEFRKNLRKRIEPASKAATARESLDAGGYPQAQGYGSDEHPFPGPQESLGFDKHINDLIWKGNVDAYGEPLGIEDPDFIKKAEERARKADQAGGFSVSRFLQDKNYQKTMQKGKISEGDFNRAYIEAQQALTQIMAQSGRITQQQFIELIQQNEVRGIELQAYQKAFQDIMTGR